MIINVSDLIIIKLTFQGPHLRDPLATTNRTPETALVFRRGGERSIVAKMDVEIGIFVENY